jgi:hypothetical protein
VYVRRERTENKGGVGSGWTQTSYELFMYGAYVCLWWMKRGEVERGTWEVRFVRRLVERRCERLVERFVRLLEGFETVSENIGEVGWGTVRN